MVLVEFLSYHFLLFAILFLHRLVMVSLSSSENGNHSLAHLLFLFVIRPFSLPVSFEQSLIVSFSFFFVPGHDRFQAVPLLTATTHKSFRHSWVIFFSPRRL